MTLIRPEAVCATVEQWLIDFVNAEDRPD